MLLLSALGRVQHHPYLFIPSYIFSFLFLVGMLTAVPVHWHEKQQWIFIAILSIILRIAFFNYPASSDVYRYIWEGNILNKGFNPYLAAPDSPVLKSYVDEVWRHVSHKNLTACYPPLSMLIFQMAAAISPTVPCFKGLVLLFDSASISLLALLIRDRGLPPNRIALYALNPLVLVYIAGEGHLDVIQVFFILLCFYLLAKNKTALAFFSLGCGVMVKYFAILIAPFLVTSENWKKGVYLIVALAAFYLPFWTTGTDLFSSLMLLGTVNSYNDSIAALLRTVLGSYSVWAGLFLLLFCLSVIFVVVHDPLRSSYLALSCSLLLLATLNPWYLVLITPFLAFFPSRAWLYLQAATIPCLYLQYHTAAFYQSSWITLLEYLPFYGMVIWDARNNRRIMVHRHFPPARTISAIVPALNESDNIQNCIETLKQEKAIFEIVVADGGSVDGTQEIAKNSGAAVIPTEKGRGRQIKSAIDYCKGDIILIVHADCFIQNNATSTIISELNSKPEYVGGAVEMHYAESSAASRFLAFLNNARSRWTGISFGDQAQFFRKEALDLIGGYPDLMLMEDVELSMRLKEIAPLCLIPAGVVVSKRRWTSTGFWSNSLRVVWLCLSYLVRRRLKLAESGAEDFYERYYRTADEK